MLGCIIVGSLSSSADMFGMSDRWCNRHGWSFYWFAIISIVDVIYRVSTSTPWRDGPWELSHLLHNGCGL